MTSINIQNIVNAYARLKGIQVKDVLRHAAKDFVQAAKAATPTAQVSKSPYYTMKTKSGRRFYVHESQIQAAQGKSAKYWYGLLHPKKGVKRQLRKVRVHKGWSKATWVGVMKTLGMVATYPKKLPSVVETKSELTQMLAGNAPKMTIADEFRIDDFGKGSTAAKHQQIAKAGFALAAKRMVTDYARMLRRAWK